MEILQETYPPLYVKNVQRIAGKRIWHYIVNIMGGRRYQGGNDSFPKEALIYHSG